MSLNSIVRFKIMRGTTAQRLAFIPMQGELVADTTTNILYIGDGVTYGGVLAAPLAAVSNKLSINVRNETGSPISKSTPVTIVGHTGSIVLVAPADCLNVAMSDVIGLIENDLSNNSTGLCVISGEITNIDMSAFSSGDQLWLKSGGGLTNIKPVYPNYIVTIGNVENNILAGSLFVHINDPVDLPNLPNNHVPIGVSGGNTTTTDLTEFSQDAVGNILVDTASIDFTYSDATPSISAVVLPAGVNHNLLNNYVTNQHIDHSTVSISAGTGLSGGGDITTSRTISMPNVGTAGTYGTSTSIPIITTDAQGRVSSVTPTTIPNATTSANGLMSATDKTKLDAIGGVRIIKSGEVLNSSFAGNPKKATVTFGTAMANTTYTILITGQDARTFTYESKATSGFVINANANAALAGSTSWMAITSGETGE